MLLIPQWIGILPSYSRIASAPTVREKNSCGDGGQRTSLRFRQAPRPFAATPFPKLPAVRWRRPASSQSRPGKRALRVLLAEKEIHRIAKGGVGAVSGDHLLEVSK
jgi:hypothetical protein